MSFHLNRMIGNYTFIYEESQFLFRLCVSKATIVIAGVDISRAKKEDAGAILTDKVRSLLSEIGIPNGLTEMGYTNSDIPAMVAGAMPQVICYAIKFTEYFLTLAYQLD